VVDENWTVEILDDPEEFTRRGGAWVVGNPVDANVIGTVVAGSLAQPAGRRPPVRWLLVLDAAGDVGGVAMHRIDYELFLPDLPPGAPEQVAQAVEAAAVEVPGVSGGDAAVREFSRAYHRLTGRRWEQAMASRVYVLDALKPPDDVPGERRTATAADVDLVAAWAEAFLVDSGLVGPVEDQRNLVSRRIAGEEISLWVVAGEAVSMAAVSPLVGGVGRVNLVYTPPAERGHGYGAAVSAAVTQRALDEGADTCMLYADVANPTSNGVYRRIGYRKIGDSVTLRFT
jgi:predicted GNAT family acetyltransferase